jgi:hypothetical protein
VFAAEVAGMTLAEVLENAADIQATMEAEIEDQGRATSRATARIRPR